MKNFLTSCIQQAGLHARVWTGANAHTLSHRQAHAACWRSVWEGQGTRNTHAYRLRSRQGGHQTGLRVMSVLKPAELTGTLLGSHQISCGILASLTSSALIDVPRTARTSLISTSNSQLKKVKTYLKLYAIYSISIQYNELEKY